MFESIHPDTEPNKKNIKTIGNVYTMYVWWNGEPIKEIPN